jgi:hypothetical protein
MPWRGPDGAVELGTDCFSVSALGAAGVARIERRGVSPAKKKRTNSRWPSMGINSALGPIPTTPGGWGLRNPESKGPSQRSGFFSQFSRAFGGRKWGGIMIPANDHVTAALSLQMVSGCFGNFNRKLSRRSRQRYLLRRRSVGAIMSGR